MGWFEFGYPRRGVLPGADAGFAAPTDEVGAANGCAVSGRWLRLAGPLRERALVNHGQRILMWRWVIAIGWDVVAIFGWSTRYR